MSRGVDAVLQRAKAWAGEDMPLNAGQVVGDRYSIQAPLGAGGMGAVYRAWDTRLDAPVALKEMVPQPGLSPQVLAGLRRQFRQEASVLANLDHSHLVDVLDFFEERGNAYLVMRFVQGESLAARIQRLGAASQPEVLLWADELLAALEYCHARGIIHRDIKPQNVIIRPDGSAVLVDFGLVKLWDPADPRTKTAMRGMGTPEYAPLEQYDAAAGHTDPRTDIYGLGATLYHALTGRVPPTITSRILDPKVLRAPRALIPTLDEAMEQAIVRAMEVHPGNRFANAGEMRTALAQSSAGRTHSARTDARTGRERKSAQSRPVSGAEGRQAVPPKPGLEEGSVDRARATTPEDQRARRLAVISLILGVLSLATFLCYGVNGLIGIGSILAGRASRRRLGPNAGGPARMALAGIVMGAIGVAIAIIVLGSLVIAGLPE